MKHIKSNLTLVENFYNKYFKTSEMQIRSKIDIEIIIIHFIRDEIQIDAIYFNSMNEMNRMWLFNN